MKTMNKKVNPRNRPATMADVKRAKTEAQNMAAKYAIAIVFTALLDKHGFTAKDLQAVWKDVEKLSMEIAEGRLNINDLLYVLKKEYSIELE